MGLRSITAAVAALAAVLIAGLLLVAAPAGAVDNPDYTVPPSTTVVRTEVSPRSVQRVATAVTVRPVRSRLAITGADVGQTAAIGATLVLVGAGVLVVRRRRPLDA